MMSYWRNNRERVMGQQVVWLPDHLLPDPLRNTLRGYGAIVPQVVVCGTLTRRASEPTWMTASNANSERIGSELRALVQAPPGYKFVGADVDSQELWIAALLGDSASGVCGGSAFGWAVLAGDKRRATDLHALTARAAAVRRDHAKVINYARIYGAGQNFAERLLKQFNPTMTISEAKSKAAKMFSTTKGRRVYRLKEKFSEGFIDEELGDRPLEMSANQAMRLAKLSGKKVDEMFERPVWVGGTESQMFNKLEEIAVKNYNM
ncbi:DNA polymerase subunit gamma-1, mitochondrial-like [Nymphalis io]|uniref:DNA polymerase subunit gamma-1, mitochondrial-like n=1 Tax=Inachis io TaxID=171585 RepID=UPI002166DE4D|nr:DNA polymerase subunit gamma-1, mitochondrial-like [Nymphalis io]